MSNGDGDLLRLIAEIQLAAGEIGDGVENAEIGQLFFRVRHGGLLVRIANAERINRHGHALQHFREIGARER